jgi:hypothetical protein
VGQWLTRFFRGRHRAGIETAKRPRRARKRLGKANLDLTPRYVRTPSTAGNTRENPRKCCGFVTHFSRSSTAAVISRLSLAVALAAVWRRRRSSWRLTTKATCGRGGEHGRLLLPDRSQLRHPSPSPTTAIGTCIRTGVEVYSAVVPFPARLRSRSPRVDRLSPQAVRYIASLLDEMPLWRLRLDTSDRDV